MKTLHEKASYIACGGNYQPGSVRYNRVYERAEQEIGEVLFEVDWLRYAIKRALDAMHVDCETGLWCLSDFECEQLQKSMGWSDR